MKNSQIKLVLFIFLVHLLLLLGISYELLLSDDGESIEGGLYALMILDFPCSIFLILASSIFLILVEFNVSLTVTLIIFQILGTINWTILILTTMYLSSTKKRMRLFFLCFGIILIVGIITSVIDCILYGFDALLYGTFLISCVFYGFHMGFIVILFHYFVQKLVLYQVKNSQ
jgi:hypothetical protein